MKKTLVFELFASILVVALLAGFNALVGDSSQSDRELTLLPEKSEIATMHTANFVARRQN